MRLAVGRGQLRELRDEPREGEPQLIDERGQPELGQAARRVRDAVPEEGAGCLDERGQLFDKMHCQEPLQKDMSASHVSMRSLRGGMWS